MAQDARFEDGQEGPLRLTAQSTEDLNVMSALLQDAVTQPAQVSWMPRKRRLAVLFNRFRWEDKTRAETEHRPFERVQSTLIIEDVMAAQAQGVDAQDTKAVLSLLALRFDEGAEGAGKLFLMFAGGAEMALRVECLSVQLQDMSRPYEARAKSAPDHDA